MTQNPRLFTGYAALVGGTLGLLLAPIMVIVKYMTGWAIIPRPVWVAPAQTSLGPLLEFATPQELWTVYGSVYTVALLLMLVGVLGLEQLVRRQHGARHTRGYWIVVAGLCLVIPGDAIHSWTWHQNGLTIPTPGTNPVANTAYAIHMMGMNLVMIGTIVIGISALRRKCVASWLAWTFVLILPSAVLASVTALPTTPSGGLWLFSILMIGCGFHFVRGAGHRLVAQ